MPEDGPQEAADAPAVGEGAPAVSTAAVMRSKNMWLVMICSFVACSMPLLFNSYVVNAFLDKGMEPALTSLLGVVFNISLVCGAILAGTVAGKVGKYNGVYLICCVVGGICIGLTYFVPMGPLTFVCLALGGVISAGSLSLNLTRVGLLFLTGDFGPENNGIAGGMNNTAMGLGMFILPTVTAAIMGNNYVGVFTTIVALFIVIGVIGRFLMPELGEKGELAQKAAAMQ